VCYSNRAATGRTSRLQRLECMYRLRGRTEDRSPCRGFEHGRRLVGGALWRRGVEPSEDLRSVFAGSAFWCVRDNENSRLRQRGAPRNYMGSVSRPLTTGCAKVGSSVYLARFDQRDKGQGPSMTPPGLARRRGGGQDPTGLTHAGPAPRSGPRTDPSGCGQRGRLATDTGQPPAVWWCTRPPRGLPLRRGGTIMK
jgi:hypothetical protein